MTMGARILLCLLIMGLASSGFAGNRGDDPVDGVVTETDDSGALLRRYSVNEAGQKHGDFEEFWPDGTTFIKATYEEDLLDGRELRYFPSGKRHMVVTWNRGVLSGRWERFFENGQRAITTSYKRGVQAGKYIQSSEDGKWVLTAKYRDGVLDGAPSLIGRRCIQHQWFDASVAESGEHPRHVGSGTSSSGRGVG